MIYRFNFILLAGFILLSQSANSKENHSKADLTSSALRGNIDAQYDLCRFLHIEGSDDFAIGWCEKAAMSGNADAAMLLAWILINNPENQNNIKDGYIWLSVALAQKHNFSAFNEWQKLSPSMSSDRKSLKRLNREINNRFKKYVDPKEKRDVVNLIMDSRSRYIASLKNNAKSNNRKSQALLGVIYEYDGDLSAAFKWYKKAAESGYIDAQSYLGRSDKFDGVGKLIDDIERYTWLYLSLAQRYNYVDRLLLDILGDRQEDKNIEIAKLKAQDYYNRYAGAGDLDGLLKQSEEKYMRETIRSNGGNSVLGKVDKAKSYKSGLDILNDTSKSILRIRRYAESGNVNIQYSLGYMYEQGIEFPKNTERSLKWYKKAAMQGYAPAQFALGQAYFNNLNKASNKVEAYSWLDIASRQGNDKAGVMRDIIAKTFDKEEKRLAGILSRKYYRLYVDPFQK